MDTIIFHGLQTFLAEPALPVPDTQRGVKSIHPFWDQFLQLAEIRRHRLIFVGREHERSNECKCRRNIVGRQNIENFSIGYFECVVGEDCVIIVRQMIGDAPFAFTIEADNQSARHR
ncbi:MAG: hypothetical protein ABI830_00220 [Pseudolabrys sp.]